MGSVKVRPSKAFAKTATVVGQGEGPVIQRQEALTFNQENGGSNPSRPTINVLIAKQCDRRKCNTAMHIHRLEDEVIFSGCEPSIVDIWIEHKAEGELEIKGKRSTKTVRCVACKGRHLISSFEEVKDGSH